MKNLYTPNPEKGYFGNVGKGLAAVLGISYPPFLVVLMTVGYILNLGAFGIKFFMRKKQGAAILGFAWVNLLLHFILIIKVVPLIHSFIMPQDEHIFPFEFIQLLDLSNFYALYFLALIIAVVFHHFRDFQPPRIGEMESHPDYTGKGILSFLSKNKYVRELYINLVDPFIAFTIGVFISSLNNGAALGFVVKFGSICLLTECLLYLAAHWYMVKNFKAGKVMSKYLSDITKDHGHGDHDITTRSPKI